jgi:hypothetical protein
MPAIFADQRLGKATFHRFQHKNTKSTLKENRSTFSRRIHLPKRCTEPR